MRIHLSDLILILCLVLCTLFLVFRDSKRLILDVQSTKNKDLRPGLPNIHRPIANRELKVRSAGAGAGADGAFGDSGFLT